MFFVIKIFRHELLLDMSFAYLREKEKTKKDKKLKISKSCDLINGVVSKAYSKHINLKNLY